MTRRPEPVSRSAAALEKGCNKATLTRAARGVLRGAVLTNGDFDRRHPDYIAWQPKLSKVRGQKHTIAESESIPQSAPENVEDLTPPSHEELMQMTVAQVADQWGSFQGLATALKCKKLSAESAKVESYNATRAGRLIPTALVHRWLFAYIDERNRRMLEHFPVRTAAIVHSQVANGATRQRVAKYISEAITTELRGTREHVLEVLYSETVRCYGMPPDDSLLSRAETDEACLYSRFAEATKLKLEEFLPRALEHIGKTVARMNCPGGHWDPAIFGSTLGAFETQVAAEISDYLRNAICHMIDAASLAANTKELSHETGTGDGST